MDKNVMERKIGVIHIADESNVFLNGNV